MSAARMSTWGNKEGTSLSSPLHGFLPRVSPRRGVGVMRSYSATLKRRWGSSLNIWSASLSGRTLTVPIAAS